ncbi:hypothetical protein KBX37_16365 [Micromonospora sp. U56]|uniref:COR domain-containing protein n=1 Tax=Micromonospora sp. U56 TaxID=2824900 RepID=UPI001B3991CE|nr:COR domain-containing protein [Micromonospora sp. U56]MBQ0894653.1 hypothetical protein [Micromonospora sp. U56]
MESVWDREPPDQLAFEGGEYEIVESTEEDEAILRAADDSADSIERFGLDEAMQDETSLASDDVHGSRYSKADRSHSLILRAHSLANGRSFLDVGGLDLGELGEISLPILRQYRHIDLSSNGLSKLPKGLSSLRNLRILDLGNNDLTAIPAELCTLARLEVLNLSDNSIDNFPDGLDGLRGLRHLDLSGCQLRELPRAVGSFSNLTVLRASANNLTELPQEIQRCVSLDTVSLDVNHFDEFPPQLLNLTNLRHVDLSRNLITDLSDQITRLGMLLTLNIGGNMLAGLPESIGSLPELRELDVSRNRLDSLPATIGRLSQLRHLDVSYNRLAGLPAELSKLSRDIGIDLAWNPLSDTLASVADQGVPALFTFLESLEHSRPQYEAKLILVGEGGVGKSTLIAALRGDEFVQDRATTHGIELAHLDLPHPNSPISIMLNSWDFGGQDVYRITHQFFFSRRALYLLVWKPREGQEQNSIEEWCRRIRLRTGSDARIIVVATHADERRPELDFGYLRTKYPEVLVGSFSVDSESGRGVAELRNAIANQAASLPQMGELMSDRWIAARDRITSIAKPHISRLTFERICAAEGLDEESTQTLANLLHDLGYIIYYSDDESLRELIVLQPEWLTKAIGYVLEDEETRDRGGVLMHARLQQIWSQPAIAGEEGYPAELHPYFLRLMEKFDITYRLPDEPASLVAQLVPFERPTPLEWEPFPRDANTKRLRLICRTADEAPGLIAWLTVRNHQFSVGRHWRRGVLLVHEAYASQAVLELSPNNVDLTLTVMGPAPEYFFHYLRDGIEELIMRRWRALQYHFLIPCGRALGGGKTCTGYFAYQALVKFRQRGEDKIICLSCVEWSEVSTLLTGFGRKAQQLDDVLAELAASQKTANATLQRLEATAANTAGMVRVALRMLSAEVSDSPRLFTFVPEDRSRIIRTVSPRQYFLLTLWCEAPGAEHRVSDATYRFRPPKDWIQNVGPYAVLVVKMLQFVVPIAAATYGATISPSELATAKADLDLTKTLAEKLPAPAIGGNELDAGEVRGLTRAEGAGLRALRQLLVKLDPAGRYGDLRRVRSSSGDLLWVCPEHHRSYDPGLPELGYAPAVSAEELG